MVANTELGQPVQMLYAAINKQNLDMFDQAVAEQVEYVDYALDETIRGVEAFKKYFTNWWTAFPQGTGEILNLIASDDQVVVEVIGRGDQTSPFETKDGKIAPTQRAFEFHFCQVFKIRNGKIISGHCYSDANKISAAASETQKAA